MPDTYSTNALIGIVAGFPPPTAALLDRYFTRVIQDESEEIHFDVIPGKRRVAPFVLPTVEGQVVDAKGHTTKTFKPAYIKDKRVFNPATQGLKRALGERIGGELTPQQRRDAYLAFQLQDQLEMLTRRMEVMASEVIRTGKLTIEGEKYPKVVLDFTRDAALTPAALAGGAKWDQSTAKPLKDLKGWQKLVRQKSGTNPVDVIMGDDAVENFIDHADVKARLDNRNIVGAAMQPGSEVVEGLTFHGVVDRMNIFSYSGWYVDPLTGTEGEIWPKDIVALTSSAIEGVRAFGAILDGKAGLKAMPFYAKIYEQDDPSAEFLLMQSAPVIVPTRPDASLAVDVV